MTGGRTHVETNPGRDRAGATNRRRHTRVPVGLPVQVHVDGGVQPITVELMDIAAGGARFRTLAEEVRVDQRATFTMVVAGSGACTAEGRVARTQAGSEFVVVLEKTTPAFRAFVRSLAS